MLNSWKLHWKAAGRNMPIRWKNFQWDQNRSYSKMSSCVASSKMSTWPTNTNCRPIRMDSRSRLSSYKNCRLRFVKSSIINSCRSYKNNNNNNNNNIYLSTPKKNQNQRLAFKTRSKRMRGLDIETRRCETCQLNKLFSHPSHSHNLITCC